MDKVTELLARVEDLTGDDPPSPYQDGDPRYFDMLVDRQAQALRFLHHLGEMVAVVSSMLHDASEWEDTAVTQAAVTIAQLETMAAAALKEIDDAN